MFSMIKERCGIPNEITVYDSDIQMYLDDALEDMKASGVPERLFDQTDVDPQALTAVTLYVRAYLGDDRADTEKYLDLYRKKVFRLTLEDENADNDDSTADETD